MDWTGEGGRQATRLLLDRVGRRWVTPGGQAGVGPPPLRDRVGDKVSSLVGSAPPAAVMEGSAIQARSRRGMSQRFTPRACRASPFAGLWRASRRLCRDPSPVGRPREAPVSARPTPSRPGNAGVRPRTRPPAGRRRRGLFPTLLQEPCAVAVQPKHAQRTHPCRPLLQSPVPRATQT